MTEIDQYMQRFSSDCETILQNENHPAFELACVISSWVTWIWERPSELAKMEPELAEVKFLAWKEQLDFHLWADTTELKNTLQKLKKDNHEQVLAIFAECRKQARQRLVEQGYERINPDQGSLPSANEVITDSSKSKRTPKKELDGRIFQVEPGAAGYKKGNRILAPAQAIFYRFDPQMPLDNE